MKPGAVSRVARVAVMHRTIWLSFADRLHHRRFQCRLHSLARPTIPSLDASLSLDYWLNLSMLTHVTVKKRCVRSRRERHQIAGVAAHSRTASAGRTRVHESLCGPLTRSHEA